MLHRRTGARRLRSTGLAGKAPCLTVVSFTPVGENHSANAHVCSERACLPSSGWCATRRRLGTVVEIAANSGQTWPPLASARVRAVTRASHVTHAAMCAANPSRVAPRFGDRSPVDRQGRCTSHRGLLYRPVSSRTPLEREFVNDCSSPASDRSSRLCAAKRRGQQGGRYQGSEGGVARLHEEITWKQCFAD